MNKLPTHRFEAHTRQTLANRLNVPDQALNFVFGANLLSQHGQCSETSWRFSTQQIEQLKAAIQSGTVTLPNVPTVRSFAVGTRPRVFNYNGQAYQLDPLPDHA